MRYFENYSIDLYVKSIASPGNHKTEGRGVIELTSANIVLGGVKRKNANLLRTSSGGVGEKFKLPLCEYFSKEYARYQREHFQREIYRGCPARWKFHLLHRRDSSNLLRDQVMHVGFWKSLKTTSSTYVIIINFEIVATKYFTVGHINRNCKNAIARYQRNNFSYSRAL